VREELEVAVAGDELRQVGLGGLRRGKPDSGGDGNCRAEAAIT
jgi:hypothetical protein